MSAHQLERWSRRLAAEKGDFANPPDQVLTALRNSLEHLDEADLDDDAHATPSPDSKGNRSLRALPGSRLLIGTRGALLFELVDPAVIEQRAAAIVDATEDDLMSEADAWVAEIGLTGESDVDGV